jgi:hypothetical protein
MDVQVIQDEMQVDLRASSDDIVEKAERRAQRVISSRPT